MKKKVDVLKTKYDTKYNDYNTLLSTCSVKESVIREKIKKEGKNNQTIIPMEIILNDSIDLVGDTFIVIDEHVFYRSHIYPPFANSRDIPCSPLP